MTSHFDTQIIETNLAGLYSEDHFTRELALFQLGNHLSEERVLLELNNALQRETDQKIRAQIESMLELSRIESSNAAKSTEDISESDQPLTLAEMWKQNEKMSVSQLVKHFELLEPGRRVSILCDIIASNADGIRLVPLLAQKHSLLEQPEVLKALAQKLCSSNDVLTVRLLSFFSLKAPAFILKNIKHFLMHENFYVKVQALKLLHKYAQPQALRLVSELIVANRNSEGAIKLLFLFPFEEIRHIVLNLIDNGEITNKYFKDAIENLVGNNPDLEFFERLTSLAANRGEEIADLENVRLMSARALKVAGLIEDDPEEFAKKALQDELAKGMLPSEMGILEPNFELLSLENSSMAGQEAEPEPEPEPEPAIQTAANDKEIQPRADSQNAEEASENAKIDSVVSRLVLLEEFDGRDLAAVKRILSQSPLDEKIAAKLLKIIRKFSISDADIFNWLESQIENGSVPHRLVVMQTLAELAFARLQPHIPTLCLSSERQVAVHAIRICRKQALGKLMKLIEQWISQGGESFWKAAITALLQIRVEEARKILIPVFLSTEDCSLIKFFSPALHNSPDFHSLMELEKIFDASRGQKRQVIHDQIELMKEALNITDQSGDVAEKILVEAGIKEKWGDIAASLEDFSYLANEDELVNKVASVIQKHWFLLLVIAVLSAFLAFQVFAPQKGAVSGFDRSESKIEAGNEVRFSLVSYKEKKGLWLASNKDGVEFFLKLENPEKFSFGFQGNFKIQAIDSSGSYPVLKCKLIK